ncbi:CARDB domain-containing protein [Pelagibius sp.]|uniref:CARDB domain-containing protein n=1 Tax=Pelagibius sp. TaxID=1931238 RepID=UPI003B500036
MPKYRVQGLLASVSLIAALTVVGVGHAAAQPDLVPIVTAPMSANVGVQNVGASPAPASQLIISCDKLGKAGGGGCPDAPDLGIYENPAYPYHATIEVPELAPGESYNHVLSVWDDMVWPEGTYIFSVTADAGNAAVEANEANNGTQTSYTQLPQPGVGQKPQLPLQARPGQRQSRDETAVQVFVAELGKPDLMSTSLGTYIGGDHSLWNQVQTVRPGHVKKTQVGRNKDECVIPSKVRLMNIGQADSGTFKVQVFDDGKLRATKTVSLKKGQDKWVNYDLRLNEGTNKVVVKIDPKNQVAEQNEKNNVYNTTVEVPFDCDGVVVLAPQGNVKVLPLKQKRIPKARPAPSRPTN